MKLYTFATSVSQCHGHGDYSDSWHVARSGPYGSGPYPPVFSLRPNAELTIKEPEWRGWRIVELELVDVEDKPTNEIKKEIEGAYYAIHFRCPKCGGINIESSTVGYIPLGGDFEFKDENWAKCDCGWRGIIHDLVP